MEKFIITTDSASDLPQSYLDKHHILCQSLFYRFNDEIYGGDKNLEPQAFYQRMRNGEMPVTNAIIPLELENTLRPYLESGYDILHIAFASILSSSYQNAVIACNNLKEDFPERRLEVIDSCNASMGQGYMVHKALQLQQQGKNIDEIIAYCKIKIDHFCSVFTVNDLFHLQRGGRVSKSVAIIGTIINLKPILYVNKKGELKMKITARGRKKSLHALVNDFEKNTLTTRKENDIVFISHGDCLEDANMVAKLIKEKFNIDAIIGYNSPTIGAHTGPGVVGLFYYGDNKEQ